MPSSMETIYAWPVNSRSVCERCRVIEKTGRDAVPGSFLTCKDFQFPSKIHTPCVHPVFRCVSKLLLQHGCALVLMFCAASTVYAHGSCVLDSAGEAICAPAGGGLKSDSSGEAVCGPGQCLSDSLGQVKCARQPGGGAMVNSKGKIVCVGGCILATSFYCQVPRE